jgi:hypothetical protein
VRAGDDPQPSPGRRSRHRVKASEADLDRIERRLERMPLELGSNGPRKTKG